MHRARRLLAISLLLTTAIAGKPYIDGGVGQSFLSQENVPAHVESDDGFAWNINIGYLFTEHVALEMGYIDYANADLKQSSKNGTDRRYAYLGAVKYHWLIDTKKSLFAKLGLASVNSTLSNNLDRGGDESREQTNINALVGFGGMYKVDDNFYLSAQYTVINKDENVGYSSLASFGFTWYLNNICRTADELAILKKHH